MSLWIGRTAVTIACLVMVAFTASSMPEICDNALDDDGDGLVDLNDPECACDDDITQLFISNPSFEELDCCPANGAEVHCASGWVQASDRTTDFLHTCGWNGWEEFPPPLPFPDGVGAIGFRDGRVTQAGPEWNCKEYVGTCLNSPFLAGKTYTLKVRVGFVDQQVSPAIDLTLFGSADCGNLPFGAGNQDIGCPANSPGWVELGTTNVGGNGWLQAQITFIPATDIDALVIGPGCNEVPSPVSTYYFLDNISIVVDGEEQLHAGLDSEQCVDFLTAPADPDFDYQWYHNGVAIVGQILPDLLLEGLPGGYQVLMYNAETCILSEVLDYVPPSTIRQVEAEICSGEAYTFGDRELMQSGEYLDTITYPGGCDSIIMLTLKVIDQSADTLRVFVLPGEAYTIAGKRLTETGDYRVAIPTEQGCDRIIFLQLREIPMYIPNIFSPNDDGANDNFLISSSIPLVSGTVQIFNRWGHLVYQQSADNLSQLCWDGTLHGGVYALSGVYVYRLVLEVDSNLEKILTGTVTLVR